jgi:inner membrane protein
MFEPTFWHWFILAVVCITIEVFMPGAFFLGMGIAAAIVGLAELAVGFPGWEFQVFCFAVLSLVTIVVGRRYFKGRPIESDQPLLNRRGAQYVGRTFTLQEPIVNGQGKIKVDDSTWKVLGEDCEAGATVVVTGVAGVMLQVDRKTD